MEEPEPQDTSLSRAELTALHATEQIDRHVPDHTMSDVAAEYKFLLRGGRNKMCAISRQSEKYLAWARSVFRERGMPEELAYLALVESGYRPDAVSSAGAVGAWQFMPGTATNYGLTRDSWQDDRLDPYRATEAAADYLLKLYGDFGDWPTAIAAYNSGEGKMGRAMLSAGAKNFYEVRAVNHTLDEKTRLKDETRQYVPRFLAVSKIMRKLPELGFDPINPEKVGCVERLTVMPGTDLKAFSQACNLSWSEFASYNQHHKHAITRTDRETFVYVPPNVKDLAYNYLRANSANKFAGWQPVRVSNGKDTLEKISRRANVPLSMLAAANPGQNRLKVGQIIICPPSVNMATIAEKMVATAKSRAGTHTIATGETLFAIARKYGVSVPALMAANGITNVSGLKIGLALNIPGTVSGDAPQKGGQKGRIGKKVAPATYKVQSRDNLWAIARKHNVTVADLKRWNNVDEKNLKAGVTLVVAEE